MFYDSMIKTEKSDDMYEAWQEYREELTDTILSYIESYHIKRELLINKNIRLSRDYGIEDAVAKMDKKPVLAIWGAGGCNDIDVKKLSKYFKLVLIDHQLDVVTEVIKRFNLPSDTVAMDMKFWDVSDDEYRMFEALLSDGKPEEIKDYLGEISGKMPVYNLGVEKLFDHSVVIGLASQLNARFMALAQKYPNVDLDFMAGLVGDMNKKAVDALWNSVSTMTKNLVIYGYEATCFDKSLDEYSEEDLFRKKEHINEEAEEKNSLGEIPYWIDENLTNIMGSRELETKLKSVEEFGEFGRIANCRSLIWNFTAWKSYLMLLVALER